MTTQIAAPGNPAMIAEAQNRADALANAGYVGKRDLFATRFLGLLLLFLFCILTACAMGGPRVYKIKLSFDFFYDSPGMEVLDFQFGDSGLPKTETSEFRREKGLAVQKETSFLYMPKPEFVYVKWLNMQTGEVFEERAELKEHLPDGLDDYEITFL